MILGCREGRGRGFYIIQGNELIFFLNNGIFSSESVLEITYILPQHRGHMLRFANKPDNVFTEIISDALDMAIDQIEEDIELEEEDGFVFLYFDEKFIESFGGIHDGIPIILNELRKIQKAHVSKDVYMPTDIHFKMLDRILRNYCDLYNDVLSQEEDSILKCNGKKIQTLSFGAILDFFFWDTDYDLDERTASALFEDKLLREQISSVSIQAVNTALGKPVDFSDIVLEKWGEPDWSDSDDYETYWLDSDDDDDDDD